MIECNNLVKSFEGRRVLDGLCLSIERGETMVVLGPSGCGKSVLLKHLIGLLKPEEGRVLIDGVDIAALRGRHLDEMRSRFGMVFQGGALFDSLSVWENVGFVLRERGEMSEREVRAIASEKLAMVGLEDIEERKPAELSGGMRKRVALARAIAADPEIILYDEPTTGIDPVMADVINHLIADVGHRLSATSVVVTHDISSAYQVGDRLAVFDEGRIIEVGSPRQVAQRESPVVRRFLHEGSREGRPAMQPRMTKRTWILASSGVKCFR